jgi:Zn-dependent peptidase ImmA (M78 family)
MFSLSVREFALWELERIASEALAKAPKCISNRRVDIERLMQEGYNIEIIAFHELTRNWKTYAFIDTTAKMVFVDADLMDNVAMAKKYRFTLGEELAHKLIHTSLFANCKTIENRLAIEDSLDEMRKARLENNAKALASAMLMPKTSVQTFVESIIPKFTDRHGQVCVEKLASEISHEYDVNFKPAKRRLKTLGYHRSHGWDLD